MDAGRDMDALIAEHVMGIDPASFRYRAAYRVPNSEAMAAFGLGEWTLEEARRKCDDAGVRRQGPFVPEVANVEPYSTDIAAAWTVVKNLLANGYRFGMSGGQGDFHIWFGSAYTGGADTAPLAICRAALTALTHQPDTRGRE